MSSLLSKIGDLLIFEAARISPRHVRYVKNVLDVFPRNIMEPNKNVLCPTVHRRRSQISKISLNF